MSAAAPLDTGSAAPLLEASSEARRQLVVLADTSKFAARGSLVVCPLSRIHTLITDSRAPPEALDMLADAGVQTIVVEPEVACDGGRMSATPPLGPRRAAARGARHREGFPGVRALSRRLVRRRARARCTRCSARTARASRR